MRNQKVVNPDHDQAEGVTDPLVEATIVECTHDVIAFYQFRSQELVESYCTLF